MDLKLNQSVLHAKALKALRHQVRQPFRQLTNIPRRFNSREQ
jgi:hypothetical protein